MRLLLYSWKANNEQILADNLIKLGFEIQWFDKECKHFTRDMELAAEMIPYIHRQSIEAVVSFNYFPIISMICDTCKVPYYAWVYDCPHFTLYARQITLPCNHIGIFDREMVRNLQDKGVQTVRHVPLSVDVERFAQIVVKNMGLNNVSSAHRSRASDGTGKNMLLKYICDISFVGSLYTDEYNYYDKLLDVKDKAVLDRFIREQCFCYDRNPLGEAFETGELDIHMIRTKMERHGLMLGEDYFAPPEDVLLAAVLEKKVTVEERRILLTQIAQCGFSFKLYTGSNTRELPVLDAFNQGIVDYNTQMPLAFASSRINLNISLRSIHSGIPLRVLDIMACGGFVLSNWQPELAEYFAEGEELALFESKEECIEKIDYYLAHEDKRKEIAAAGKRKVQELFSYEKGLERLFGV